MTRPSHLDDQGQARMVNVADKPVSQRTARASAAVTMDRATVQLLNSGDSPKGDVLAAARLAGIMAAKQTSQLIPLCHPLSISSVEIHFQQAGETSLRIESTVTVYDRTGAEMEALTAVAIAALTLYDMCKSVDRTMTISEIQLEEKSGGKSGHFVRKGNQHESNS